MYYQKTDETIVTAKTQFRNTNIVPHEFRLFINKLCPSQPPQASMRDMEWMSKSGCVNGVGPSNDSLPLDVLGGLHHTELWPVCQRTAAAAAAATDAVVSSQHRCRGQPALLHWDGILGSPSPSLALSLSLSLGLGLADVSHNPTRDSQCGLFMLHTHTRPSLLSPPPLYYNIYIFDTYWLKDDKSVRRRNHASEPVN